MAQVMDVKQIERRAQQAFYEDGVMEILLGLLLIVCGGLLGTKLAPFVSIFSAFVVLYAKHVVGAIKNRWVYPRIGYVKFPDDTAEGKGILQGLGIAVAIVAVAAIVLILFFGSDQGWDLWLLRVIPAVVGVLLAMGPLYAAGKFGLKRYYVFAVLFALSGFIVPFLNLGNVYRTLSVQMVGGGVLALVVGAVYFLRFVRTHPVIDEVDYGTE